MKRRIFPHIALLAISVPYLALAGTSNPDLAGKSKRVDNLFAAFVTGNSPGGAAMVIRNGRIAHEAGYGLADLSRVTAITPKHAFHLGSIGKQFTAIGVMMLVEQGKIGYDDPIGMHLPELSRFGKDLTIRRLLHHTSGIPDCYGNAALNKELMRRNRKPANGDLIAVLGETGKPRFPPGEKFSYNNTGYDVLGALIERVSGQSYPEFMQQRIFGPLAMTHTFAMPNPERLASHDVCLSYVRKHGRVEACKPDPLDNVNGSGSIYSNLEDLFLYDQALYSDRLVKQPTLAEAFRPAMLNDGRASKYGFAWELGEYMGEPYIAHAGAWLGFDTYYLRFPNRRLSVFVLMNLDFAKPSPEKAAFRIATIYLEESGQ
jgi:CubicO group peptidase (beta-lactamase class C family)